MSDMTDDWPDDATLNITNKSAALASLQPAAAATHTGKRRSNTVDVSTLPPSHRHHITSQSNTAAAPTATTQPAATHASNKKLRPNDRLNKHNVNIDKRSIGGNSNSHHTRPTHQPRPTPTTTTAAEQLHATSAASQWRTHTGYKRAYTVSVAIPGSIISNCQTSELKTYVSGQIARSLAVYNVDEVVIYNEDTKLYNTSAAGGHHSNENTLDGEYVSARVRNSDPNVFLARILQYLETPQYLRKAMFPVHPDLKYAGLLNPLDAPHHVRATEDVMYREGVTVEKNTRNKHAPNGHAYVNVGLRNCCLISTPVKPNVRVTVKVDEPVAGSVHRANLTGTVVSPSEPRTEHGMYCGYNVRLANGGLNDVFTQCPYDTKYDLLIGTSERGVDVHDASQIDVHRFKAFKHMLIVFGGLAGLEDVVAADESIEVSDAKQLFDVYINTCIHQGSRTIRTEEAIPITMAALQPYLRRS